MIADTDILQIVSEIHLYSMVIIETADRSLFGIYKVGEDRAVYFRFRGFRPRPSRLELIEKMSKGERVEGLQAVTLEDFLSSMSGKKPAHIWLEHHAPSRREMGFVSIRELKDYLRALH